MKFFGITTALAAIAIPGIILTSCDEVKENERYIDMGEITAKRTVLLEEFTGQYCTNCPLAHESIEKIEEQYGDNFIAVSIHATSLALKDDPTATIQGLKQPEGDIYAQHWSVTNIPIGIVNRQGGLTDLSTWQGLVRTAMENDTPVDINLSATLDETGKNIDIATDIYSGDNIDGKLQLWVVESGIIAPQFGTSTFYPTYTHNNVFRTAVNGTWGEDVELITRESRSFSHTVAVNENWDIDNTIIVAFVYTDADGVLQAAKCAISGSSITE